MEDALTWLIFFVSASVVVGAGTRLARYGDQIAEESGIGGLWVGAFVIAIATSLPEVVTDVTAAWIDEPDLAAGDLFGSSMANMMILALLALVFWRHQVWQRAALRQTQPGALAIVLTLLAVSLIVADLDWAIGQVGVGTIAIVAVYVAGTWFIFRYEHLEARRRIANGAGQAAWGVDDLSEIHLRLPSGRALLALAISAGLILVAAPFVASSASDISDMTGIEASFVGVTFLAITTSLPELASSFTAVRLGSYDLAVGNLFGSNAFNMLAFIFVDTAYRPGPIFEVVATAQVVAALFAVLLMSIGMWGIIYRVEGRVLRVEPGAVAIALAYIGGMLLVFQAGV